VVEACEVVAGLYPRLHRTPVPQLDRLSVLAARWAEELADLRDTGLAPRRFVDQAAGLAAAFATDPDCDRVLVHGDLHYANVLAGVREPWLVIDPHPLAGDPAYEVAPLLWNRWDEAVASRDLRGALLERLYTVVDVTGMDEDRVRDWVTVREMVNVLWASGEAEPDREWITRCTTIVKAVQR
jgi:streptomycin 6-kinase